MLCLRFIYWLACSVVFKSTETLFRSTFWFNFIYGQASSCCGSIKCECNKVLNSSSNKNYLTSIACIPENLSRLRMYFMWNGLWVDDLNTTYSQTKRLKIYVHLSKTNIHLSLARTANQSNANINPNRLPAKTEFSVGICHYNSKLNSFGLSLERLELHLYRLSIVNEGEAAAKKSFFADFYSRNVH